MTNKGRVAAPTNAPASDGMSGPTETKQDEKKEAGSAEVVDAAATLVALKKAIANGDADAMAALNPSVLANKEAMAQDLVAMLDTADSLFAKEQLANMLGELGDPAALPALQNLLGNSTDDAVRTAAVRALGQIPDASSVKLLTAEFGRTGGSPMPPSNR